MNLPAPIDTNKSRSQLAAGTYLVGDPCYAFDNDLDENWQGWLANCWGQFEDAAVMDGFTPAGGRVVASQTEHGDGTYEDGDGFEYGVDAGLLGAVHIGFLANLYPSLHGLSHEALEEKTGMRVVDFDRPFDITYEAGWVQIGHIGINTSWDANDEDEDEDDEEELPTCEACGDPCGGGYMGQDCLNS